jgi:membrane dipeptidase
VSRVLASAPVLDGHNDLAWEARVLENYDFDALGFRDGSDRVQTDLPRMRAGGLGAQFWSVFVPQQLTGERAVTATLEQVDAIGALIASHDDVLAAADGADDVRRAWGAGRIACLMGAEGGHSIGNSLGTLRALRGLGVGYMTLTHNDNVDWADSATDLPRHDGLSAFGREVVREMNRIGMLVDLSHVSADTMRDALAVAEAPAIFSHSSAFAVCDSPRNVPDDVLATLAAQGGVCMVTFVPKFVTQEVCDWDRECAREAVAAGIRPQDYEPYTAFQTEFRRRVPQPECTIADVADHVEHVREAAGIGHVGLGGDYDGMTHPPSGLEDVSGYPRLLAELADRGWSDADLAALTSGNVLRVLDAAHSRAREIAAERSPSTARIEDLDGPLRARGAP